MPSIRPGPPLGPRLGPRSGPSLPDLEPSFAELEALQCAGGAADEHRADRGGVYGSAGRREVVGAAVGDVEQGKPRLLAGLAQLAQPAHLRRGKPLSV